MSISGATNVDYGGKSIPAFDGVAVVHPAYVSLKRGHVVILNISWWCAV